MNVALVEESNLESSRLGEKQRGKIGEGGGMQVGFLGFLLDAGNKMGNVLSSPPSRNEKGKHANMNLTNPPSRNEKAKWSMKINLPHNNLKELQEKNLRRHKAINTCKNELSLFNFIKNSLIGRGNGEERVISKPKDDDSDPTVKIHFKETEELEYWSLLDKLGQNEKKKKAANEFPTEEPTLTGLEFNINEVSEKFIEKTKIKMTEQS
ncbi:hypothetical protein F3Y22_tig00111398pilonHSYRG00225 [Hibiscus syriacus]|uniref:Uncharacterized protein n=1 Tax=Hibiscus syriacus TaxID=106335 RepID=A0A6A2YJT3_HIBSY|nr:hypothetical protein F3Y22_tig00111398pilonHSYRG00225 [Hibiscus syriacus]